MSLRWIVAVAFILSNYLVMFHGEIQCGIREPTVQHLIVNGWAASNWPWHGAVFSNKSGSLEYQCGATILTDKFVITAAHCCSDSESDIISNIVIKVGLTQLNSTDRHVQTRRISRVLNYTSNGNSRNDIALLKMTKRILFDNIRVRPICVWNGDADFNKIVNRVGFVAGWGRDGSNSRVANDLQESSIPIVSTNECLASSTDKKFLKSNPELFCAGYTNGTHLDFGDSGGGLYVKIGHTWFIRGISSFQLSTTTSILYPNIDPEKFVLFTDVVPYQDWIKSYIPNFDLIFPKVNFTGQCGIKSTISINSENFSGGWPWHGALFHMSRNQSLIYQCGVTILSEYFVLSTAHCTLDEYFYALAPPKILVKVGLSNLNDSKHVQLCAVKTVIRHDFYNQSAHEDDIALLHLKNKIIFDGLYAQPICLFDDLMWLNEVNRVGFITGWGKNQHGKDPNELQEASMEMVSRRACIDSDPGYFRFVYRDPKTFCAGSKNGTNAGVGDSGGGFYVNIGDQWFLRGVVSSIKAFNKTNFDYKSYLLLMDVGYYQRWIKKKVPSEQFLPQ